jgi:predicted DNA-binding ribbon-helix-helix protein
MTERKLVSFRLPEDLIEELREQARRRSVSVTELLTRLVDQGLQNLRKDQYADKEAVRSVDKRIARTKEEISEYPQPIQEMNSAPMSSSSEQLLQVLAQQSQVLAQQSQVLVKRQTSEDVELQERLSRLESMMQELVRREQS